ncbi:hypothetical protein CLFE_023120 [Clostridium felsineum DSM 794]|nr:AbiH family protein [Clostridium felsineum]URZ16265.1 hypothetical protein CLFE_023120 [Clostridium felsineum DSM 794]
MRKNDIYLSFNYTHTLEEIYRINQDQILHIHGEALEYTENTLVIGHGNGIRIQEIKKDLEEYEKDYFDQASCNRENELKCILHNLRELRKDVNLYINNCDTFLDKKIKHKCIDTIKIYGLSMGEVDLPYLINIRNKFLNAKWSFSYYSQNDFYNVKEIAKKYLSLEDGQYERFEFYNRYSHDIESEIVALHKIKQFKKI